MNKKIMILDKEAKGKKLRNYCMWLRAYQMMRGEKISAKKQNLGQIWSIPSWRNLQVKLPQKKKKIKKILDEKGGKGKVKKTNLGERRKKTEAAKMYNVFGQKKFKIYYKKKLK